VVVLEFAELPEVVLVGEELGGRFGGGCFTAEFETAHTPTAVVVVVVVVVVSVDNVDLGRVVGEFPSDLLTFSWTVSEMIAGASGAIGGGGVWEPSVTTGCSTGAPPPEFCAFSSAPRGGQYVGILRSFGKFPFLVLGALRDPRLFPPPSFR